MRNFRVLLLIQLALLALAIAITLLIGSNNGFVMLFALPPLALAALLLLALIIRALRSRQYHFLLKVLLANLIVFLTGTLAIFFTGSGYAQHMLKAESDTMRCELIPPRIVLADSSILDEALVVHHRLYTRKHLFSSDYVLVSSDQWESYSNGWIDYYQLVLRPNPNHHSSDVSLSGIKTNLSVVDMSCDDILWMGSGTEQIFDFRDGMVPRDTIILEYSSPSRQSDTALVVRMHLH